MAFSVTTNMVEMNQCKRPWFELDEASLKCPPKKKVKHRAIPDSYGNHLIATEVFGTKIDGQDVGLQASFTCEDLYKIILTPGSHVLVSPTSTAVIELASLVAMNYRGIGEHPVFVVTTSCTKAVMEDKIQEMGVLVAKDYAGIDKGPMILEQRDIKDLKKYIVDQDVSDPVLIFDYDVSKANIEYLLDGDLKTLRTMVIMSTDHVSEINWHSKMKFPHKAYFVNCVKMLNTDNADLTIVTKDTVAHRGSKSEIESSLKWIWNSKIEALASNSKKKNANGHFTRTINSFKSWIHDLKGKMEDDTCPICMEESCDRVVMDCCSASYCSDCVFTWVNEEGTCPNCRAEANINTMHVIK